MWSELCLVLQVMLLSVGDTVSDDNCCVLFGTLVSVSVFGVMWLELLMMLDINV